MNRIGWHFGGDTLGYDDGRPHVVGQRLDVPDLSRRIECCEYGMHASRDILAALDLATGGTCRLVRLHDIRDTRTGKAAAVGRTPLREVSAVETSRILAEWAGWCAERAAIYARCYASDAASYAASYARAVASSAARYARCSASDAHYASCSASAARSASDASYAERRTQSRELTRRMIRAMRRADA